MVGLFWLLFMKIVENIVEDQVVAVLVLRLKGEDHVMALLF